MMASGYYKEKEKEHAFITIEKDLKSGKIPEVVLLCGKEDYLIRWYTDALVDRYVSDVRKKGGGPARLSSGSRAKNQEFPGG